jgi:hypothetical protein
MNTVQYYTTLFWYRFSFRRKVAVLLAAAAFLFVYYLVATAPKHHRMKILQ